MPPLSTSDKVLDRDVVKRPDREFEATFSEWASDNVEQIIENRDTTGTMFDVPKNFTLFVTSAWITLMASSGANSSGFARIMVLNNTKVLLGVRARNFSTAPSPQNSSMALSFPMPIKVERGDVDFLLSGTEFRGVAGFTGFLLPKKISIR